MCTGFRLLFCGFIDTATGSCCLCSFSRRCRCRCRFLLSIERCIIFIKDCHVHCFLIALFDCSSCFSASIIFILHFIVFIVICCYHGGNTCPSSTSGSNTGSNCSCIIINNRNSSWRGFNIFFMYLLFFVISILTAIIIFLLPALAACFPAADFFFGKWSSKGLDHGNEIQTRRDDRQETRSRSRAAWLIVARTVSDCHKSEALRHGCDKKHYAEPILQSSDKAAHLHQEGHQQYDGRHTTNGQRYHSHQLRHLEVDTKLIRNISRSFHTIRIAKGISLLDAKQTNQPGECRPSCIGIGGDIRARDRKELTCSQG
mmetsp:Transcript_8580/g.14129  ORF Transcript_8580/g.14129 Transcript_8580/m.14129 type:complete len:315 (-) Transcript_8580:148-1092(-)